MKKLFNISTFIPIICLIAFFLPVLHVSLILGHLPRPSMDDPKFFNYSYMNMIIPFIINLINPPIWAIIVFLKRKDGQKLNRNLIIYITSVIVFLIIFYFDPFDIHIIEWYLD